MDNLPFKVWLESTLDDLYSSAVRAYPRTTLRQHAIDPIRITRLNWTPYLGMRTLYLRGLAQNEGRFYNPTILFKGVAYGRGIPIIASDGRRYLVERLSAEANDTLLRCDCPDFRWRFKYYNYLDKSLYGPKGKKYEGTGPPANPRELPGMCKHLIKMSHALRDSGLLV